MRKFFSLKAKKLRTIVSSEREVLIVGLIAFGIYFTAIWWGLPHATNPLGTHSWEIDAVTGMQTLAELHNLFVQPKEDWYLAYPPFHYIVIGICYAPYLLFLYLSGHFSQPTTQYPFGLTDPVTAIRNLTLIARMITVLMASGIVINAYLTARTIWDRRTARLTAVAAALPTTMVFYARTGNLEVPMLFWISLAILILAKCLQSGFTVRRAAFLGIISALAVATKDSAYGVLTVGLIILVGVHYWYGTPNTKKSPRWKSPLVLFVAGFVSFLLASGFFISPHRFFGHLEFVRNFDKTFYLVIHLNNLRPATFQGYATLTFDIFREFFTAIGPVLLVTGIVGLIVTWRSTIFTKILSAMLFGYVVLVIFPVRHMQYRYIIIPAFIFAFFIARAIILGLEQKREWLRMTTFAAMIIGFGWIGLRAVDLTYQMIFDSRYEAGKWINQHGNAGDKIAFSTVNNILPPLENKVTAVQLMNNPAPIETLKNKRIRFVLVQPDWSSEIGAEHSHFFPKSLHKQLKDGNLGYKKAATFETAGLFHGFFLDLPLVTPGYIVNPSITIYELEAAD